MGTGGPAGLGATLAGHPQLSTRLVCAREMRPCRSVLCPAPPSARHPQSLPCPRRATLTRHGSRKHCELCQRRSKRGGPGSLPACGHGGPSRKGRRKPLGRCEVTARQGHRGNRRHGVNGFPTQTHFLRPQGRGTRQPHCCSLTGLKALSRPEHLTVLAQEAGFKCMKTPQR